MNYQLHCVACEDWQTRDLTEFECWMIVGAQSIEISISKMAALVKCLRATVINVYRE